MRPPPGSTLFPYTTLFRSFDRNRVQQGARQFRNMRDDLGDISAAGHRRANGGRGNRVDPDVVDRKSTRLNSSHMSSSYAVFRVKKKKQRQIAEPELEHPDP